MTLIIINYKRWKEKRNKLIVWYVQIILKVLTQKTVTNRQNRYILQSNCATCGSKISRFIKERKALGILSNLGIKTPLSQVPLLNILF